VDLDREHLGLHQADLVYRAREGLLNFTDFTKPNYKVNWHHRLICQKLNQFARGEVKRLMVFMPPRYGKSELVSRRLPAFLLGRDPLLSIISTSYSADLAARMNRDVQRIIDSDAYRKIFPDTRLNSSNVRTSQTAWLRNSDTFEVVGHGGTYRCAGVGGGITGMGADVIIVDDPIKNQEEADSLTYREKIWEWYTSTLYTRLNDENGRILVTLTRWHEDDLAGRLLQLQTVEPDADKWEVISFPAIRETDIDPLDPREIGEALWPEKHSIAKLANVKATAGSRVWGALYQQNPKPIEGTIIKHSYLVKRWKALPARFDQLMQSWDLAFKETKSSDYIVGQLWGRVGAEYYLIDQKRARLDFPATIQAIKDFSAKHPKSLLKLVEDKANGPAVIASLQKEIPGLVAVNPEGSKESRLNAVSPLFEAGNVIIPDATIANWVNDYVEELCAFPRAAKDDQVDATTQALLRLRGSAADWSEKHVPSKATTLANFKRGGDSW
jgi:predicted phage terminase large subunit-like protein